MTSPHDRIVTPKSYGVRLVVGLRMQWPTNLGLRVVGGAAEKTVVKLKPAVEALLQETQGT